MLKDNIEELSEWEEIEDADDNMLIRLEWDRSRQEFFDYLQDHTHTIQSIVSHHLSLQRYHQCTVAKQRDWLHGSFNVCIPISISNWQTPRILLRCPLPHRLQGERNTQLIEEKIRCEAATYAWVSKHCPKIPIPRLWAFGLPSGLSFTPVTQLPWYRRAFEYIKCIGSSIFQMPYYKPFVSDVNSASLKSGYILIDFIEKEQGSRLSERWPPISDVHKKNFFRSLSRIMLDLARPLDKIGSFTVHNSGKVTLSNRPLTLGLAVLENEGIPAAISPDACYLTTDSYIHDLLDYHDLKLEYQPNSMRDKDDLDGQMAVLVMLRASLTLFTQRRLRRGPFVFTLTDSHENNIFVNEQYDITGMVDLEWTCSLPLEMQYPPFWLSGYHLDNFLEEDENRAEKDYATTCDEFLQIFEKEDRQTWHLCPGFYTQVMRDTLEKKRHWYWNALKHPRAAYDIFLECLQPLIAPAHTRGESAINFQQIVSQYWTVHTSKFVERKMLDRKRYIDQLRSKHKHQYTE